MAARVRHFTRTPGRKGGMHIGLQFVDLKVSDEGRLGRILTRWQREVGGRL